MENQQIHNNHKNGYIALVSVLIISAVIIAITLTVTLLSIGEEQSSLAMFKGEDVLTLTEGCAEDALLKVRSNVSYAGGAITRPEGTCLVTVTISGVNRTINVSPVNTKYSRTVVINAVRSGSLQITSWKEI